MDKDAALEELLSTIDELSLKQFRYGTPEYDCQQVMMRAAARFRRAVAVKIINEGSNSDISLDGIHKFLLKNQGLEKTENESIRSRTKVLAEFEAAPLTALFCQKTIAAVRNCSTSTLERDRWVGGGISFTKVGARVFYRKADVVEWLGKQKICTSTSDT